MPQTWSDSARRRLLDTSRCPRCMAGLVGGVCPACRADLRGEEAQRLWQASVEAAAAIDARQDMVDALPVVSGPAAQSATPTVATPPPPATGIRPDAPTAVPRETSSFTVQSVLAITGAGLFGVAAIVFTFFNPDLTDTGIRSVINGVVTALFLGAAALMVRRGLQFSGEAVGALGIVFVALDVYAFSLATPSVVSPWVFAGIGTLVGGAIMLGVGTALCIRTWVWLSAVGLTAAPAMFGYAGNTVWSAVVGHLGVAATALVLHAIVTRVGRHVGSRMRADHTALTLVHLLVSITVLVQLGFLTASTPTLRVLGIAAVLAALTVLSGCGARAQIAGFWNGAAGALAVSTVGILPFALNLEDPVWYLALVPAAAGATFVAAVAIRAYTKTAAWVGALVVAIVAALPTVIFAGLSVLTPVATFAMRIDVQSPASGSWRYFTPGLATILGLIATALVLTAAGLLYRITTAAGRRSIIAGLWVGGLAALTLTTWVGFLPVGRVAVGLVLALMLALGLRFIPKLASWPAAWRIPLTLSAHTLLVLVAVIAAQDATITVVAGAVAVAVLIAVAQTAPASVRFVHVGIGYAYALGILATGFTQLDLETIVVLCLTSSVGTLVALVATEVRRLSASSWWAVLVVTLVPFLIGVGTVVFNRSGWPALSTGLIFALALTLLLSKRPGLTGWLRAGAAALLVPSLAVVIITLGSEFLAVSASPITLPIIAVIVAAVLPSAGLVESVVRRRGVSEPDARGARIALEATSLLTAVIAVLLALNLRAAGPATALLVLLIVGIGAAATSIWGGRRYGWWVAFASFTGALWCVWSLAGVTLIEPYLLPPAVSAAIIGAVSVARGSVRGIGLYATGLAVAVIPTVVIAAAVGSEHETIPWRALVLLTGSFVLIVIGTVFPQWPRRWADRMATLARPTFVLAIIAAAAGTIQGSRYGQGVDHLSLSDPQLLMLPVLVFSLASAGFAALAARQLLDTPSETPATTRWAFAPAVIFLVLGPLSAISSSPLAIWTLWALMLAILLLLVVTVTRAQRGKTALPPAWFLFTVAFVTAVTGWGPREILRVEGWSLVLGGLLLLAGVIAMVPLDSEPPTHIRKSLTSWPNGFRGSWPTLWPGLVVVFSASIAATVTDPTTWRAVLVIAVALASLLVGSLVKLAAPFIVGLVVLPIEIIVVFAAQIGRNIESVPWWITLAVAAAVLLIIAVTSERRSGAEGGIAARLRDLR